MKQLWFAAAALALSGTALAGGNLETLEAVAEVEGGSILQAIPIKWDKRCVPVEYTLDTTQLPNALVEGVDEISAEDLADEIQASLDPWNEIPTSYIDMQLTRVGEFGLGPREFDFINQVTFDTAPGFGALASSPSTSLNADVEFVAGDDIDGDGDSDVFDPADFPGQETCFDADNDGDIEFPAGFYEAGTILDNDVQFSETVSWELEPSGDVSPAGGSFADILGVSVHEFGHSHGLSHTLLNQISASDGTGATMFPFIDTGDPDTEASAATPSMDDIAWSSFVYPEGSEATGIAALQEGDIAFDDEFGVITGIVFQDGVPVLGANLSAVDIGSGETLVDGFSGFALLFESDAGALFLLATPATSIADPFYRLPVPEGMYQLILQATDGDPAPSTSISFTTQVGDLFGQQAFTEEIVGPGAAEDAVEFRPDQAKRIRIRPGREVRADAITNDATIVSALVDGIDFIGTGAAIGPEVVRYAQRFPNEDILPILQSGGVLANGLFQAGVLDASQVPEFARAVLAIGRIDADGNAVIDLDNALAEEAPFLAQDSDLAPFFIRASVGVSRILARSLESDPTLDVFLVLETLPDSEADIGPSGIEPLLALEDSNPQGNSFLSADGGPFAPIGFNWAVELVFAPAF
ncbi:MAG: hypothetical protein ACFB22_09380 [Rhodothalassiaceae bacterium]